MPPTPYIGVCDFTSSQEVSFMLTVLRKMRRRSAIPHRLMMGVMMSYKTLNDIPCKWTDVFPPKKDLPKIFSAECNDGLLMNTLHYADYTDSDVENSLYQAIQYCGFDIHALQLDMIWPRPEAIANAVHMSRKKIEVVLQVSETSLKRLDHWTKELSERLEQYVGIVDFLLFDMSMGQGKALDPQQLLELLRLVKKELPSFGLAVAGGLGPGSVEGLIPIVQEFPNISIDAQGRLRPSGSYVEPIDWTMAAQYVEEAAAILAAK